MHVVHLTSLRHRPIMRGDSQHSSRREAGECKDLINGNKLGGIAKVLLNSNNLQVGERKALLNNSLAGGDHKVRSSNNQPDGEIKVQEVSVNNSSRGHQ